MQAHAAREFLFVFSCQSSKETATAAVLLFGYHAPFLFYTLPLLRPWLALFSLVIERKVSFDFPSVRKTNKA